MTTTVRIGEDYVIETFNPQVGGATGTSITLDSPIVTIKGDLVVVGSSSEIKSTTTVFNDAMITLNTVDELNSAQSAEALLNYPNWYSGIEVYRGATDKPAVRWNEALLRWEFTDQFGTSFGIAAAPPLGEYYLKNVVEDLTPQLGGDLDVNNRRIVSTLNQNVIIDPAGTGTLRVLSPMQLIEMGATPASVAGYNTVYAATPAGGGTGLYVTNATVNQELVSKSKAIVYAIIF